MKLVYFGNDMLSSCVDSFLEWGWTIAEIYVNPHENIAAKMTEKASELGLQVRTCKPASAHLQRFVEQGVTLFFSADYKHKIPIPPTLKYGVNMHTSLLPEGRGATPLPYLVTPFRHLSGLTLHKLSEHFDQGDIILKQEIPVGDHDTLNSLTVKMHLQAPLLLNRFLKNIDAHYDQASPQSQGSQWPVPPIEERLLDCTLSVSELQQRIKRFGHFGLLLKLGDGYWRVVHAEAVPYEHGRKPGDMLFEHNELFAVCNVDGFVCIPKHCIVAL